MRRDPKEEYEYMISRIERRVNRDLETNNYKRAISRLEGFLEYSPTDAFIHDKLGQLYFVIGDFARAGKHWYFKNNKEQFEIDCVLLFKKSFGNDPLLILRKLPYRSKRKTNGIDDYTKKELLILLEDAVIKHPFLPPLAIGLKRHLSK